MFTPFSISILALALLLSSCAGTPPPNHLRAAGFFSKKIILQSQAGFYVTFDKKDSLLLLRANEPNLSQADTFYFCDLGNNVAGLQASNSLYVAIHLQEKDRAIVHQVHIAEWEKFKFKQEKETLILQGCNNLFVMPNEQENNTIAAIGQDAEDPRCHFKMIQLP